MYNKHEREHLLNELLERNLAYYKINKQIPKFDSHPLFAVNYGDIEDWEIIS